MGQRIADAANLQSLTINGNLLRLSVQNSDAKGSHFFCLMGIVVAGDIIAGPVFRQMFQHRISLLQRHGMVQNITHQNHQIGCGSIHRIQQPPLSVTPAAAMEVGDAGDAQSGGDFVTFYRIDNRFQSVIPTADHEKQTGSQQYQKGFFPTLHTTAPLRSASASSSRSDWISAG